MKKPSTLGNLSSDR